MTMDFAEGRRFSFRNRPISIPGEMRIGWRLSILLLMLFYSRAQKASLAKLHILNAGLRTQRARKVLESIVEGKIGEPDWQLRVEPAFGRAINFASGEGFVSWENTTTRAALKLSPEGKEAAKQIALLDALEVEKTFLSSVSPRLTEALVSAILRGGA